MADHEFLSSPIYYSSSLLYDKKKTSFRFGNVYEVKAYKPWDKRRYKLGKTIYTRQEYTCMVYADNVYEAYITLLDYGYIDIVIINP